MKRNIPYRHEHRRDHRPDHKTVEPEHRHASQRGDHIIGHLGILPDQDRAQMLSTKPMMNMPYAILAFDIRGQAACPGSPCYRRVSPRGASDHAVCTGPMGGVTHLPSDGRGREGQRDQARHVRD
jgi:hypothetical protein